MDFLGGHPLSIQLVLPALRDTPDVERLIAEFDALLPGFTTGEGKARNQSRALAMRELPNLKTDLRLALAAGALDEAVDFADSINLFLNLFGRWRERDEVMGWVERAVTRNGVTRNSEKITKAEFLMESGRGERLRQLGGQLFDAMRQLAGDPDAPPEMRALGKTLTLVLIGEKNPSLDALSPELASAVRGMLARLRG
jgi:hypothetical protein